MQNPSAPTIFLASSSPYRRNLLDRLLDHYETVSPDVDESNDQGLPADELASHLARQKAEAVAINARNPERLQNALESLQRESENKVFALVGM